MTRFIRGCIFTDKTQWQWGECWSWAHSFTGHTQILHQIGNVAYKLDLPPSSKIHPIFHVSNLKGRWGRGSAHKFTCPLLIQMASFKLNQKQKSWFVGKVQEMKKLHGKSTTNSSPNFQSLTSRMRFFKGEAIDMGWRGLNESASTWQLMNGIAKV